MTQCIMYFQVFDSSELLLSDSVKAHF